MRESFNHPRALIPTSRISFVSAAVVISGVCRVFAYKTIRARVFLLNLLVLISLTFSARAQWETQSFSLKSGWNAVFLHVDADYTTLDTLVGADPSNPIVEVWRWNPPATTQFTDSPSNPNPGSEWSNWARTTPGSSLQRLVGDAAYLVRVGTNVTTYNWTIKGRPVPPRHSWTVTGANFIGFSTVPVNPPKFDAFFARSPQLQTVTPDVYQYPGGDLGPNNPMKVVSSLFRSVSVKRGQAFWVRAGTVFNEYFGPFEVKVNGTIINFGDSVSAASVRLRNLTTNTLTVSVTLAASETPPVGQPTITAVPPLIVRTDFNPTNFVYGYTSLPVNGTRTWTLAPANTPGSEVEAVIGLNRAAITANPGSLLAGILRFTDNLGFSQMDIGVSATAGSNTGLWVGSAVVGEVGQYIKSYSRDIANRPIVTTNGSYVVTNIDTSIGRVVRPYPLRLIVHNPTTGNASLLQRVFVGKDANTNMILSLKETALSPLFLKDARRLSSVHLPWSADNTPWLFNGKFGTSTNLTTTVTLGYNDRASNPFLHSYHPQHDNLDTTFKTILPQGSESYRVDRQISLTVTPPGNDFSSLVTASRTLNGTYSEIVTVKGLARAGGTNDTRRFEVRGDFTLNRVTDIGQITPAP